MTGVKIMQRIEIVADIVILLLSFCMMPGAYAAALVAALWQQNWLAVAIFGVLLPLVSLVWWAACKRYDMLYMFRRTQANVTEGYGG